MSSTPDLNPLIKFLIYIHSLFVQNSYGLPLLPRKYFSNPVTKFLKIKNIIFINLLLNEWLNELLLELIEVFALINIF